MYNRRYQCFHVILNLTEDMFTYFEKCQYTLDVFIHQSKTVDSVHYSISLQKLYGFKGKYLIYFERYLKNRHLIVSLDKNVIHNFFKIVTKLMPIKFADNTSNSSREFLKQWT